MLFHQQIVKSYISKALLLLLLLIFNITLSAKNLEYHLVLENHTFSPAELRIPANKKVKLIITNKDNSIEEFDSFDLNREKVLFPQQGNTVYIGPLPKGRYEYFGEYHPNTARGHILVVDQISTPTKDINAKEQNNAH